MSRAFLIALALVVCGFGAAHGADAAQPAAPAAQKSVDELVGLFNPDWLSRDDKGEPVWSMQSTFTAPASDIAAEVNSSNWFTTLVFLPFLILPQVLLLVTMFKFQDRGDGRKPATFMHHTKLENAWTAIPILTLFIVGIPAYPLLYKMDLPHKDPHHQDLAITVTGKSFAWDYEYKREGVSFGQDVVGLQEPVVLVKGRAVSLAITSNDVNHAWWVPAFGVKKDAINGRYNHAWFTPTREGLFKGQCAELCGQGHGIMVIAARVVDQPTFDVWVKLQKNRDDATKVFKLLDPPAGQALDEAAFTAGVKKYFEKGRDADRALALRYWIASCFTSLTHRPPWREGPEATEQERAAFKDLDQVIKNRKGLAERVINGALAAAEDAERPVVAAQE